MSEDKKLEEKKDLTQEELKDINGGVVNKHSKTCPNCGAENAKAAHKCSKCGTILNNY